MTSLVPIADQPPEIEFYIDDDLFVKQMWLKKSGYTVPQHSHEHDHVTMLAQGVVDVWLEDEHVGRYTAPVPIPIKAGTKHLFVAAVDNCVLYCIHNLHGKGYPDIREEHRLP